MRRIDKFTESSPVTIISSVERIFSIIFPLELSSRASFSIARAPRLFALAIFFHPLFLFSLRFKVVIFSRPPFFQPVLRFVSLLLFFFGRSCAFVFEVQGLPFRLLNIFSRSLPHVHLYFFTDLSHTLPLLSIFLTFLFLYSPRILFPRIISTPCLCLFSLF